MADLTFFDILNIYVPGTSFWKDETLSVIDWLCPLGYILGFHAPQILRCFRIRYPVQQAAVSGSKVLCCQARTFFIIQFFFWILLQILTRVAPMRAYRNMIIHSFTRILLATDYTTHLSTFTSLTTNRGTFSRIRLYSWFYPMLEISLYRTPINLVRSEQSFLNEKLDVKLETCRRNKRRW